MLVAHAWCLLTHALYTVAEGPLFSISTVFSFVDRLAVIALFLVVALVFYRAVRIAISVYPILMCEFGSPEYLDVKLEGTAEVRAPCVSVERLLAFVLLKFDLGSSVFTWRLFACATYYPSLSSGNVGPLLRVYLESCLG